MSHHVLPSPAPRRAPRAVATVAAFALAVVACADPGTAPRRDTTDTGNGPRWEITDVATVGTATDLRLAGDALWLRDAETSLIRRRPMSGGAFAGVFATRPIPEELVADGDYVFWLAGDTLFRSTADFSKTSFHAYGRRTSREVSGTMLLHDGDVYWITTVASAGCSPDCEFAVLRVDRDGGTPVVVVTASREIADIAIAGDQLYWVEQGIGPIGATQGSVIRRKPLTGPDATTIVDATLNGLVPPPPAGQAAGTWLPRGGLEATGTFVWFADASVAGRHRIMRVPAGGGTVQVLADNAAPPPLDLLLLGGSLVWNDGATVRRMPTDGGAQEPLSTSATAILDLVRHGLSLFWLEAADGAKPATIRRVAGGSTAPELVRANAGAASRLAADANRLFWLEGGRAHTGAAIAGFGRIGSMTHAGADVRTLMEAANGGPFDVDATHVYFADRFTIKRASIDDGVVERLAVGTFYVESVATDGSHLYWVEHPMGTVRRVPAAGGPVETLGGGNGMPGVLRLDATHAYWLEQGAGVRRVPKTGGAPELVLASAPLLTDFVVAGDQLFAAEWDGGRLLRAPKAGGSTPCRSPR